MRKRLKLCLVCLLLSIAAEAQVGNYTDDFMTPEFSTAWQAILEFDNETALPILRKISRENPRSSVGAAATGKIAELTDSPEEQMAMLRKLATEYPGSLFEIKGKLSLIARQYDNNPDSAAYLRAIEGLAVSYGGPSFDSIFRSNHGPLVGQVKRLSEHYQRGLSLVYDCAHLEYDVKKENQAKCNRLAHFSREAFGFYPLSPTNLGQLERDYMYTRFGKIVTRQYPKPFNSPAIRILTARKQFGPRPQIGFEVAVGPWPCGQVELHTSTVTLDGVDIRRQLSVQSLWDEQGKGDRPLEILRFRFRPTGKLAPGHHVLHLQFNISRWKTNMTDGISSLDYPFTVSKSRDDDEDEDRRWADED